MYVCLSLFRTECFHCLLFTVWTELSPTTAGLNCVCVCGRFGFQLSLKQRDGGGGGKKEKIKDFHSRNRERTEPRPFSILYAMENMRETLLDAPNFLFFFCIWVWVCVCVHVCLLWYSLCASERREKIQRSCMTCARLSELCSYITFIQTNLTTNRTAAV